MLMANVWPFVIIAVLMAVAASSSEESESRSESLRARGILQRVREWWWPPHTPPTPPFFTGDKRPEGLDTGTEIQQKLPTDPAGTPPYFVSLFDPVKNIAIYSAYKVTPTQAVGIGTFGRKAVSGTWRNPIGPSPRPGVPGVPVNLDAAYKETFADTKVSGQPLRSLTRGHMNPSGINTFDKNFMEATFTLTNTAPQFGTSNCVDWQVFEEKIRLYAKATCGSNTRHGSLYLLTGTSDIGLTVVGGKPIQDTTTPLPYTRRIFSSGVTLVTPRAVWTAGCCVWMEPGKVFGNWWKSARAASFAVMSNNHPDATKLHQTEMSVTQLEELLTAPTRPRVNLFPGDANCRNIANDITLP